MKQFECSRCRRNLLPGDGCEVCQMEMEDRGLEPPEVIVVTARITKCVRCQCQVTWAEQRKQFNRCLNKGMSRDKAKLLMPRCQKCLTAELKD